MWKRQGCCNSPRRNLLPHYSSAPVLAEQTLLHTMSAADERREHLIKTIQMNQFKNWWNFPELCASLIAPAAPASRCLLSYTYPTSCSLITTGNDCSSCGKFKRKAGLHPVCLPNIISTQFGLFKQVEESGIEKPGPTKTKFVHLFLVVLKGQICTMPYARGGQFYAPSGRCSRNHCCLCVPSRLLCSK